MRVLLVGSGGREHALAMAIARSPKLTELFIAPGNPGTAQYGKNIHIKADDITDLVKFAQENHIDLIIPGPELPLVKGLTDACNHIGIACAGPTQQAAQLEGSKSFTKSICDAAHIPTAQWQEFTEIDPAISYLKTQNFPIVIKADGLAAGKGVIIANDFDEAEKTIKNMLEGNSFGNAGHKIVIEEFLSGEEVSLFAFCDGDTAVLIGAAQDHKRIGDNDTGPNTGGMGAVSPPPFFDKVAQEAALNLTVRPMLKEMNRRGTPFRGVIFAGLMLTSKGPYLIEYNTRFGDPEAEVLLPRLQSDLLEILFNLSQGKLSQSEITFSDQAGICIIMAAKGYPGIPITGGIIRNIEQAEALPNTKVFHAGTALNNQNELCAAGGRVLCISVLHEDLETAQKIAYQAVNCIDWKDGIWRKDIGNRALRK
ncbi:phosphoribosylamine--glycine ligase [Commensalibacter oyaizuii]|uniref:Phosphoribosylamine--glycine ligase n=1 Tax=Commensalibacter oyaizuii TaxID=3043873 RepID=A0ABT6Q1U2_9PROT|nr:phosphoribosylamine--glycine ligase [Commensalibacter sp. TBRC 16381]MDI2091084.1 phosphoribosylamine--glycine ligase [Commensalibacter sp. TBRC 16381]